MLLKTIRDTYYSYEDKIRLVISTKILDIAESPSSFYYRILSKIKLLNSVLIRLNARRKEQREYASKELNSRKIPENTKIKLASIVYVIPFEYENFNEVKFAFKQLSSRDKRTRNTINDIIKSKDNIGFSNWANFGIIGGEKGLFPSKIKPIKNVPQNVDSVELSYTRIMPSFALMTLKFNLSEVITDNINNLQNKEYLETVVFKKLFPIKKLLISQMFSRGKVSKKAIETYKDKIKLDIKQWSIETSKFKNKVLSTSFFLDEYQIKGNPTIENDLKEWIKANRNWLHDYGFGYPEYFENKEFYTIYSSNIVIGFEPYYNDINGVITGKRIDNDILSRAIHESINSIINKYTDRVEELRSEGFTNLQKSSFKILKSKLSIEDLKITMMYLKRLEVELELNKQNIRDTIAQIGIPKNIHNNEENNNPADKMITNIFTNIERIKKHLEILDMAVSDVLSIENIKAIYTLQKTVFWVTVMGVIVASIALFK